MVHPIGPCFESLMYYDSGRVIPVRFLYAGAVLPAFMRKLVRNSAVPLGWNGYPIPFPLVFVVGVGRRTSEGCSGS